jgi:hypothetical protein
MLSWDIDKSHKFQTFFEFLEFLNGHTINMVVFPSQDVQIFFWSHVKGLILS